MVSVIIPIYNGEKYIDRCLGSVLFGISDNDDIEVIAVNDGSRDASSEILHGYEKKHSALRVIDKENGGAGSARRAGLLAARGEYVAFLDVDDYVEPGMYKKLEDKAKSSGADIVFCGYVEETEKQSRAVKNLLRKGQELLMDGASAVGYIHSRRAVFPFPWNKIYRKTLIDRIGFPDGSFIGEDYYMLLQLLSMTDKVDILDEELYHYVITENSVSRSGYGKVTEVSYLHFKESREYVKSKFLESLSEADNYYTTEFLSFIVAMGRNKTYNKEMIREIKAFVSKNLWNYVSSDSVPLVMKGSAVAFCINYRLLILGYKIIK